VLVLDLTRPLDESTPVYRDARGYSDPPTRLIAWVGVGDEIGGAGSGLRSPFRVTRLEMALHTGTHVDAPAHFAPGGRMLDALPVSALVGPAIVVNLSAATGDAQSRDLARHRERASAPGVIPLVLMPSDWPLAARAIASIVAWRRPLVCVRGGIDGDDPDCPATAALLRAGICLAVDLASEAEQVRNGDLLVVAPLALRGVEGAPARVLAIRLTPGDSRAFVEQPRKPQATS